ncbi:MAG: peptidyl-prolyl cis-trans isomerase [Planctomycetota bacterium]
MQSRRETAFYPCIRVSRRPLIAVLALGCVVLLATGCGLPGTTRTQAVDPQRFINAQATATPDRPSTPPNATTASTPAPAPAGDPTVAAAADEPNTPQTAQPALNTDPVPLDALVGQINGRPVYAHEILDPIDDRLAALARQFPNEAFRQPAASVIAERLRSIIMQRLIVGAATQDLNALQLTRVRELVEVHRQELIRKHGMGSAALAEANLVQDTGIGLRETLINYRESQLIAIYSSRVVRPKINVTRRDVERYYADNYDRYNRPQRRDLRLIVVTRDTDRDEVASRLDAGEPFAEVAAHPGNLFAATAGQAFDQPITPEALSSKATADAAFALGLNEHAGPFPDSGMHYFVQVTEIQPAAQRPLKDVQLEIEQTLRQEQIRAATTQYRRDLFRDGIYTDPYEMASRLLIIAMKRHLPGV